MEFWKMVAAVTLSVIVTGATAWITFGKDKVNREEMVEYIQNQTPWVRERGEILAEIRTNSSHIRSLTDSVKELVSSQQAMLVEQKVLVSRFASYIDGQKKD